MIGVYAAGILLVLGLLALIPYPMAAAPLIGVGYWLFNSSTRAQRAAASDLFFGFAILCGLIVLIAGVLGRFF